MMQSFKSMLFRMELQASPMQCWQWCNLFTLVSARICHADSEADFRCIIALAAETIAWPIYLCNHGQDSSNTKARISLHQSLSCFCGGLVLLSSGVQMKQCSFVVDCDNYLCAVLQSIANVQQTLFTIMQSSDVDRALRPRAHCAP